MTNLNDKILSIQCESTRRALLRPEEEDWDWQHRPNPDNWLAVPGASTWEERVAARPISFKEARVENTLRYMRGMYLADMRNEEELSSVTEEKKKSAINAFMNLFSPDKIKAKFKELAKAFASEKELVRFKIDD